MLGSEPVGTELIVWITRKQSEIMADSDSKCNILYIFKHEKVVSADLHAITRNYSIVLHDFQRGDVTSPSVVTLQASRRCGEDATSKRRGTSVTPKETSVKQERCFIQPPDRRRVYKSDFTVLSA